MGKSRKEAEKSISEEHDRLWGEESILQGDGGGRLWLKDFKRWSSIWISLWLGGPLWHGVCPNFSPTSPTVNDEDKTVKKSITFCQCSCKCEFLIIRHKKIWSVWPEQVALHYVIVPTTQQDSRSPFPCGSDEISKIHLQNSGYG